MLIWLLYVVLILTCAFIIEHSHKGRTQYNMFIFLILCGLIYFSGFRDGLGTDYPNYIDKAEATRGTIKLYYELIYTLLAIFVNNTYWSEVSIFLFYAFITNLLFIKTFQRYDNFFLILAAYLLIPSLFFNTFNIVRQMCACAIFVYASKFIETRSLKCYLGCLFFAFLTHVSALFLVPLYFFINKAINAKIGVILQILSLSMGYYIVEWIGYGFASIGMYSTYLNSDAGTTSVMGTLLIIINIAFFITSCFQKRIIHSMKERIVYNLFLCGVIFLNLSIYMPIMYRFAIYFYIYPFIMLPLFSKILDAKFLKPTLLILYLLFFIALLSANSNSKTVIPLKILSPLSLHDDYYMWDKKRYLQRN